MALFLAHVIQEMVMYESNPECPSPPPPPPLVFAIFDFFGQIPHHAGPFSGPVSRSPVNMQFVLVFYTSLNSRSYKI